MSLKTSIVRSLAGAAAIAVMLVAGGATAAQVKAAAVKPGDCKQAYEIVIGPSAQIAQAIWTQTVADKLGTKWAHWVGAKNKTVTPVSAGTNPQFQARAMPCFYQPVP